MTTRPEGNTISLAEPQKLVSSRDVRSNEDRSSVHRDARTGHLDCVIGLDARRLLVDVPIWPSCTAIVSFPVCSSRLIQLPRLFAGAVFSTDKTLPPIVATVFTS